MVVQKPTIIIVLLIHTIREKYDFASQFNINNFDGTETG